MSAYTLNHVKVQYGQDWKLDIPSLCIKANQTTALLGENGAGKSTLLSLLAGLMTPSEGVLRLFDEPMTLPLDIQQRRRIGLVLQQPYMLKGTIKQNLALALTLQGVAAAKHADLIAHALAQVNLSALADKSTQNLSGGELKRAAIARALVYQPDVLLLDEPFSHLDQRHRDLLEQSLRTIQQTGDTTIVFSCHNRLQAMALADETINLVQGHMTRAPLINLLHGYIEGNTFIHDHLTIHVTDAPVSAKHLAIDPNEIILSAQPLESSMLNTFQGQLKQITQEAAHLRLMIDCGVMFYATISQQSLQQLNLQLGDTVWVHFKATAVTLF
jgi:ABC-type sulfate/molybdate transport systems ATPase subunit